MPEVKRVVYLLFIVVAFISCNIDEVITTELPPEIIFENDSRVYTTKINRPLTIAPLYENADNATYQWSIEGYNGNIGVVTEPSFTFTPSELGSFYVTIVVVTDYGMAEEELRVDVVEREIPVVSLAGSEYDYMITPGQELSFKPSVKETSIPTTFSWELNGNKVSDELSYTFSSDVIGEYNLKFTAENEDGSDSLTLTVIVCTPEQMPFSWTFERTVFNYAKGRSILLKPSDVVNAHGAVYTWKVEGEIVQESESCEWICALDKVGNYNVTVMATINHESSQSLMQLSQDLIVNVCPVEGTYYRGATAASSYTWNKVYEYTPAPGQFINETATGGFDGTQTTIDAALLYAEQRLTNNNWVSLGGFGGYIIVGFDHSISNSEGYDFAIQGNSFSGSSEPGIVCVMQDENGDGLPNDTWYELNASARNLATTQHDYAVTYYRPAAAGMSVAWVDNRGNSGEVEYVSQFHSQEYYYPLWIEADSYTLRGTCIESLAYDNSGNGSYWILPEQEWGYADNYSAIDCNQTGDKANNFDIDNAIDYAGNPIHLDYVDFIKVYTAVNKQCGWIGENSTEVLGFYDCNLVNQ